MQQMEGASFEPYSITTSTGTSSYTPEEGFTASLNPQLAALMNQMGTGATNLFGQAQSALGQINPGSTSYTAFQGPGMGLAQGTNFSANVPSIDQATQNYMDAGMASLSPQFEQMNQNLKSSLFGSGTGGLKIAGGALGLGADSPMVNPMVNQVSGAQSRALTDLFANSRQRAMAEQQQAFGQSLGTEQQRMNALGQLFGQNLQGFQTNFGNQQQLNQSLFGNQMALAQAQQGLGQGMFGNMLGLSGLEQGLLNTGAGLEQIRAGTTAGSFYQPQMQESIGSQLAGAAIGGFFGGANPMGKLSGLMGGGNATATTTTNPNEFVGKPFAMDWT
jgi:hypothetical protein